MKGIGEIDKVKNMIKHAQIVMRLIYNHFWIHAQMQNFIRERILFLNPTRFIMYFISLKCLLTKKEAHNV